MRKSTLILALAMTVPAFAWASDDHSGHSMSASGEMNHDGMSDHSEMDGITAEATINSISGDKVNLTHGPIAEIGWPAMTMDLGLLDGAMIEGVEAGDDVMMMLEQGPDGMYGIRALMPK